MNRAVEAEKECGVLAQCGSLRLGGAFLKCFVSGHDFSRAAKGALTMGLLAPEAGLREVKPWLDARRVLTVFVFC
jgi:hypothetical protein